MIDDIKLGQLNRREGARYMGYGNNEPDEVVSSLITQCENDILDHATPRYIYKIFDISISDNVEILGTNLILTGKSIKEHLEGCSKAALICGTLSVGIDKLIMKTQVLDMAKAVVMDAFAGVAIEQLMDKVDEQIGQYFPDMYMTYRFGIGYGDLPLDIMGDFLRVLNTDKSIGVTVTTGNMMSPTKSVACIVGLSNEVIKSKKKGCITCNMKDSCRYRIKGERCGF